MQVETVEEFCPTDCVYRGVMWSYNTPFCQYALIEGECRKCKVSECDKYRQGKPIKPRMRADIIIEWEYEFYGEDVDSVWSRRFEGTEI